MNIWNKLKNKKKPFFVLAPMYDVTDPVFRQVILGIGRPDLFYTEFVSVDGLCSKEGKRKILPHLKFIKKEKPIIVQFFGSKPENFYKCAQLAKKLGFDGIDINMGCPEKQVERQGAGVRLILNPKLARDIIMATKKGSGGLPVSVKTRIGYNEINTKEWISEIIKANPDAIIVHGRTRKEMSKVPAHWHEIGIAAKLIIKAGIVAIGNGDVESIEDGREKAKRFGLDGIMIGRGVFKNPWIFNERINITDITSKHKISLALRHIKLYEKFWGKNRNFNNMKKFFKVYISLWPGAKSLRNRLMSCHNYSEAQEILTS
jgi:nifR3 family TIM-barrel protein